MTPQSRQKPSVLVIDSAAENLVFGPLTLTQRGQTANFVVSFDENVGASGPTLADAVLASCEADYNALQTLFGNLSLKSLPFAVNIVTGNSGASHASCSATAMTCNSFFGNDNDLLNFLVIAEESEVFMANQGKGWACSASNGEALSRILAADFYPGELPPPNLGNGFKTAENWLNSARENFVDQTKPTDTDKPSIGCGTLFINWMRYQLGFRLRDIVRAGGSTLEQTYEIVTGTSGGFPRFSRLVNAHFPPGQVVSLRNDNPFPFTAKLYFQGTDNKLWQLNADGTAGNNPAGFHTKSTPFALNGHLYFQGTDDALWQTNPDGTGAIHVGGGYKTSASPFVADYIYFRGTDDKLWRVNLDGSGGVNLGGYKTQSTPRAAEGFVFFQGTDNKLWRINTDGSGGINLGNNTTSSPPAVTWRYVYFRGTDDRLLRINLDGSAGVHLGGYKTKSTPFVTDKYIYFQGTDDKLWRILTDGTRGINLGGHKTRSSPVADGGFVYFQGTDNKLWRINIDGTQGIHLGGFDTASTPCLLAT